MVSLDTYSLSEKDVTIILFLRLIQSYHFSIFSFLTTNTHISISWSLFWSIVLHEYVCIYISKYKFLGLYNIISMYVQYYSNVCSQEQPFKNHSNLKFSFI